MLRCFFSNKENDPKIVEKDMKSLVSAKLGATTATMFFASRASLSKAVAPEDLFADDEHLSKFAPIIKKLPVAKKVQTTDLMIEYLKDNVEFAMLNPARFEKMKKQLVALIECLDQPSKLLFAQKIAAATTNDGNSLIELIFEVFEADLLKMLDLSDHTRALIEAS